MSAIPSFRCYHEPLLPASIRLLRLLPSKDKTTPIQCELFHYSLQGSSRQMHPYEALSYVWGGSDKPQSISIREHNCTSEHYLPVTENLHAALTRLRYPLFERIIWIDAVCIDQNNEREKEEQIQLMARLYALANRVVVWLGEAAEDSDQALDWIRIAGGKKSKISSSNETIQQAVIALLQRPWFRRIWVLQEVAAARQVLIMCGTIRIDGYAFCLGLDTFEEFDKARVDLHSLVRSVTYLIRGAIFRPNFYISASGRSSLDICPLGELVDMYHAHEATKRHDKVFALLGMSSDDLSEVKLLPNYRIPWEELLRRLTTYLLGQEISVETWGNSGEIAIIKSKGCILGKVFLVQSYTVQNDREGVDIMFKNREGTARWTLQTSAKSVRDGDLVCLLRGASRPTIIRWCQNCFEIIMITARPPEKIPVWRGYIGWAKLLQSGLLFSRDFILIWDWGISSGKSQQPERHNRVVDCSMDLESYFDKATRTWNIALILRDAEEYQKAEEKLQEAIKGYETAFGIKYPYTLKDKHGLTPLSWATENGYDDIVHLLLTKDGVDPDLKDSQLGRTPLSWAVRGGHETIVKLLLDTGKVDVNSKDESGQTPLWLAAERGYEAVVKLLLETGKVEVNLQDKFGQTSLLWAAEKGQNSMVKLLLGISNVEVNFKDDCGRTPLWWAAKGGHEAVVKLLLETGKVEANLKDESGRTPLCSAARGGHEAVVKLLLDTGKVDIDLRDDFGLTPLWWAAKEGHEAVVKLLLETGKVEVNLKDESGRTPLCSAARGGYETIVKLLLETGKVEVDLQDDSGRTPLWWAAKEGHEAVVKLLLRTGQVSVDSKSEFGYTPLWWAAREGHEAVVKLLLRTGQVNVDSKSEFGYTPLWWAAEEGHEAVVKLLLETDKVDVDLKDDSGRTPLLCAARGGHEAVVKLLLETGKVDVNSKDKHGSTPLLWAIRGQHKAVVKLLKSSTK